MRSDEGKREVNDAHGGISGRSPRLRSRTGQEPVLAPDFFAIGPPRTATTWLHEILRGHVNLPAIKETRFFDLNYARGPGWYAAQFRQRTEGLPSGEMAPTYFYSNRARLRIAQLSPGARIICTLRDPVDRLYSLYTLRRCNGYIRCTFEEALEQDIELIESSRYAFYLSAWFRAFGRSAVLVLLHEELARDPQSYLDRVCRHIGIPRFSAGASLLARKCYSARELSLSRLPSLRRLWGSFGGRLALGGYSGARAAIRAIGLRRLLFENSVGRSAPLDPEFALELRERMRGEVEALEALLGVDLAAWKEGRGASNGQSTGASLEGPAFGALRASEAGCNAGTRERFSD